MTEVKIKPQTNWFVPTRLASYIIISSIVVIWMGFPGYLNFQFMIYSLLTLAFTIGMLVQSKLPIANLVRTLILAQFLLEISLESGIVYVTGNIHSSFSALFLLTIVSASLVYRLVGTLMIASAVSVSYTFIVWLGLRPSAGTEIGLDALRTFYSADESAFYSIFLHLLIFYLVAFIAGYLADRLRAQDQALADTSRALRKAQLETDDILRHLNSGLLTVDVSGKIMFFNQAAERILEYREEDVNGLPYQNVFSERMPQMADILTNCLKGTISQSRSEIEIITPAGETLPMGVSTSVLRDDLQSLRGVIAIFTDLTEAKALENKVRIADRQSAVGEMSASMAHEIRNPLAAISGSVEVLMYELELSGENARLMELIIKESNRLNNILSEFLAYARIGRPAYNKVELCHLTSEVIEVVRHHPQLNPATTIRLESSESYAYVIGDENLLKQLLVNLGHNAVEAFDGAPGEIIFRIGSAHHRGTFLLEIVDNGPGIPDEALSKIYQPFFSTKPKGTGLGLAIVHQVCNLLELNLAVDSVSGSGCTFSVELARYSSEPVKQAETIS